MKKTTYFFAILSIFISAHAQIKATTSDGKNVLLFEDKTWKYESESQVSIAKPIPTSDKRYFKSPTTNTQVKSKKTPFSVFIDNRKWEVNKSKSNKDAEFGFQLKNKFLFAMMINEKVDISLESLKEIAIANAKNASQSFSVVNEEYRFVNGTKVLMMQMRCEIQSMDFTYLSYYFAGNQGAVQLITYMNTSSLNEYKAEALEFLNGLVVN